MYRQIRKKLAQTVSGIKQTEDFEWRKWLKEPSLQEEKIEGFQISLLDTNQLNQWLVKPTHEKKKIFLPEATVFPELKEFSSRKTRTILVFFGLGSPDISKFKLHDFEAKFKKNPPEIMFRDRPVNVKGIDCILPSPAIKNQLLGLKPEISEIDLLKVEKFSIEEHIGSSTNVEFTFVTSPPKIYKVKIFSLDKIKLAKIYFLKNINFKETKLLKDVYNAIENPQVFEADISLFGVVPEENTFKEIEIETIPAEEAPSVEAIYVETEVVPDINIVTNELTVSEDEKISEIDNKQEDEEEGDYVNVFESLYGFQEEGAKYLLKHNHALLNDELGLGKTAQAVEAIKNLFESGRIESALIVCSPEDIGSAGRIEGIDSWTGHFNSRAPELKVVHLKGSLKERKKKWQSAPDVLISTYDTFFSDIEEKAVDPKELKHLNCLIIDEVQFYLKRKFDSERFLKPVNPKYIWALSSTTNESVKSNLNSIFKDKFSIKNYLGRYKRDVVKEVPNALWQEKWLQMDEKQAAEYKEAFISAKEKVSWLLESGNPLRFNANIFTILHQLKQICNFSENNKKSPKTELLGKQIELIAGSNKKVIVFSQYDKTAKKIGEILKNNSIEYVSYAPGMSTKDMQNTIKNFTNKDSITAMIAAVKPSKMKITSGEIPYVILFDQSWNPASVWQTEETIMASSKGAFLNENLNVYSYLMSGTIEEKINDLLRRKGFLNKNVMEYVSADSIVEMIANQEWLEVFEMPDEEFKKRQESALIELVGKIQDCSPTDLMEKGKNFFSKLGYRNLDISENTKNNYYDIRGIIKKAKYDQQMNARFLFGESHENEEIKKHISDLKERTNNGKIFLISKSTFDEAEQIISNVTLIDLKLLTNYFYQFRVM